MVTITFHGHACFTLEADGRRVVVDPFLTGNPAADISLTPIGDNYTMGIADAVRAVEFVKPRTVIPMHDNTFDVIRADPEDFKRQVGGRAQVVVLRPGQAHTLS